MFLLTKTFCKLRGPTNPTSSVRAKSRAVWPLALLRRCSAPPRSKIITNSGSPEIPNKIPHANPNFGHNHRNFNWGWPIKIPKSPIVFKTSNEIEKSKKETCQKSWNWPSICKFFESASDFMEISTVFQVENLEITNCSGSWQFPFKRKKGLLYLLPPSEVSHVGQNLMYWQQHGFPEESWQYLTWWAEKEKKNTDWIFKIWICFKRSRLG